MATPTYTPIASITLGSSASSVTFSSIPQDYRDLVLVVQGGGSGGGPVSFEIAPNSDTSNGSMVYMEGTGSTTLSGTFTRLLFTLDNVNALSIMQFMDYSATDKHKTLLVRNNNPDTATNTNVAAYAGRWASTSAITSLVLEDTSGQTFDSGNTFALYGIAS